MEVNLMEGSIVACMEKEELKEQILSLTQDVTFEFHGKYACINPWSLDKFEVGFGEKSKTYDDINELMNDLFYDGEALSDICADLLIELV